MKVDGRMLGRFMMLPCIRSLHCRCVDGVHVARPHHERSSDLTVLSLDKSNIKVSVMSEHLRAIKTLETFRYTYHEVTDILSNWRPDLIMKALRESAASSLIMLNLLMDGRTADGNTMARDEFIGDLRTFRRLTSIHLDAMMLYKEGQVQSLVDFLPASVQCLCIKLDKQAFLMIDTDLETIFRWFRKGSYRKYLPNLSEINLECEERPTRTAKGVFRYLSGLCAQLGMRMEVHQEDDEGQIHSLLFADGHEERHFVTQA